MYERYSLSELGQISKRYEAEFGEMRKDAKTAAFRAAARSKGAKIPWSRRLDRPSRAERVAARLRPLGDRVQNLASTAERTTANTRAIATEGRRSAEAVAPHLRDVADVSTANIGRAATESTANLKDVVAATAKPVEAVGKPIESGGKALRNIGIGGGAVLAGGGIGFGAMVRPRKEKIVIEPGRGIAVRKPTKKG